MKYHHKKAVIIGAGPAGLTAAFELLKTQKVRVSMLEKDSVIGGLARTDEFKGCRFDIGPHHFVTENKKVFAWWMEIMGDDFPQHKRFTRIFYKKHFFNYPLDPFNVVRGLSIMECARSIFSYIWVRIFPIKEVRSFEDWVTNRFGKRLFSIFFKTYTEKVWGIACNKISADWSAQRIQGFSLSKAIFYAFFGAWFKDNKPRTIKDTFNYPSKGSGTLWNRVGDRIRNLEGEISLNQQVVGLKHENGLITAVCTVEGGQDHAGAKKITVHPGDYFFSTMPLRALILALDPLPSQTVIDAAKALLYRGLITVNLIIDKAHVCPDHWIYIHEKEVRVGRIGNMNNFSVKMADSPQHTSLSLEYFTYVDEPFWRLSDYELVELGKRELEKTGLVKAEAVIDGMVVRTADAYPVYDENYKQHLNEVLGYLAMFKNLKLMGRNGMHRYNNMDVAMLSAFDAVDQVMLQVNADEKNQRRQEVATAHTM